MNTTIDSKFAEAQTLLGGMPNTSSLAPYYVMCSKRAVKDITLRLYVKEGIRPVIEYNPAFVEAITVPTLTALLSIEMLRMILHHPTLRIMNPKDRHLLASNIICTQNEMLSYRIDKDVADMFPKIEMIKKIYPEFDETNDCYLEKVFAILSKSEEEKQSNKTENSGGNCADNGNTEPEEQDNSSFENEADAIKKHFSKANNEKNTEGWGENDLISEQVAEAVRGQSVKSWGNLPSHLVEQIRKANAKKFDPKKIWKDWTRSVIASFYRFNRMKAYRRDDQLSGIIPGKTWAQQCNILFAIDDSYSMAREQIEKAIGVLEASLTGATCFYCFWDGECGEIKKLTKELEAYDIQGGGTNPQCVLDKLKIEKKIKFDGIVFITDCGFEWDKPETRDRIFILQTDDAIEVPAWCRDHLKMSDIEKF